MIDIATDEIQLELNDLVLEITLNRPAKLNSVTGEMAAALIEAVSWANESQEVRCIILTGTGDRAFCAGSDIRGLNKYESAWDFRNRPDYCDAIRGSRKPVIAAVNGFALGGGLETALSCDILLASTEATFAAPEVKLGWIGGGGMTTFLTRAVGASNAALMIMTGDSIDAERALAWGLISEVTEPDALLPLAREYAKTIASRAPIAVETAKANLHASANMPREEAIAYERDLQTICFATEDAKEGRRAFAERRPGVYYRK